MFKELINCEGREIWPHRMYTFVDRTPRPQVLCDLRQIICKMILLTPSEMYAAYCKGLICIGSPRWALTLSNLEERSSRTWRIDELRKEVRSEIPELSCQVNWNWT